MAAAIAGLALWLVAGVTLWLHMLTGVPGDYLGQGYPLYPGLRVTPANLWLDAALAAIPIAPVAALARWRHWRLAGIVAVGLLWLWAASVVVHPFTIDFGTTWSGTEAFWALFFHPVHTPLALLVMLGASFGGLKAQPRP